MAIARALARGPEALLLDEPTGALDARAVAGIEALVRRLADDGLAVVVVTHDAAQVRRLATRAALLAGRRACAAQGPVAEVLGTLMIQVAVAAGLVVVAIVSRACARIGLESELAIAAVRATVQLAAVGALVTVVFEHAGSRPRSWRLMLGAATITSGGRLRGVSRPAARAGVAIAVGAGCGLAPLLISGAFSTTPRELIPVAGILIGGAMVATSLTGRRLIDAIGDELARDRGAARARRPAQAMRSRRSSRRAVATGVIPVIDQTKTVGLVTLPGTFVGLILGGASPAEAARVQLTILLALLGVEMIAALVAADARRRAASRGPGERVVAPAGRVA